MKPGFFGRLLRFTILALALAVILVLASPPAGAGSRAWAAPLAGLKPHTGQVGLDFHLLGDEKEHSLPALEVTTVYALTPAFALSVSSMGVYYPGQNSRGIDHLGLLWQYSPGIAGSLGWHSQVANGGTNSRAGGPEAGLNLSTPLGSNTAGFAQGYLAYLPGRLAGGYMLGASTRILPEWSFNLSYRSDILDTAKSGFGLGFAFTYP